VPAACTACASRLASWCCREVAGHRGTDLSSNSAYRPAPAAAAAAVDEQRVLACVAAVMLSCCCSSALHQEWPNRSSTQQLGGSSHQGSLPCSPVAADDADAAASWAWRQAHLSCLHTFQQYLSAAAADTEVGIGSKSLAGSSKRWRI
jgi:hypothetical protein